MEPPWRVYRFHVQRGYHIYIYRYVSFSLLVYIYIFLLSALTPPLHVPCIRFAIICLTANIQPNFANGIHLVAKTKTTGKTEKKTEKTKKKLKKTEKPIFFHRIYLSAKYVFFSFFSFFGFFRPKELKKLKKLKTLYFSLEYIYLPNMFFFSVFSGFSVFFFVVFSLFCCGTHLLDCEPSAKLYQWDRSGIQNQNNPKK